MVRNFIQNFTFFLVCKTLSLFLEQLPLHMGQYLGEGLAAWAIKASIWIPTGGMDCPGQRPNQRNPRWKDRPIVQMVDPWSDSREWDTVQESQGWEWTVWLESDGHIPKLLWKYSRPLHGHARWGRDSENKVVFYWCLSNYSSCDYHNRRSRWPDTRQVTMNWNTV